MAIIPCGNTWVTRWGVQPQCILRPSTTNRLLPSSNWYYFLQLNCLKCLHLLILDPLDLYFAWLQHWLNDSLHISFCMLHCTLLVPYLLMFSYAITACSELLVCLFFCFFLLLRWRVSFCSFMLKICCKLDIIIWCEQIMIKLECKY